MKQDLHLHKILHRLLGAWIAVVMLLAAGSAAAQTLDATFTVDSIHYKVTKVSPAEVTITGTTGTGTSFADGDILCKLVLPDTRRYVKVKVTSDTTSSGRGRASAAYHSADSCSRSAEASRSTSLIAHPTSPH